VNEWVNSAVARGVADANANTELTLDGSTCSGHLVDKSSDCSDADYPMDFVHQIKDPRGHMDSV
jgi:hypothetical protein